MIKIYLKATLTDGQYLFAPTAPAEPDAPASEPRSYANTFKVGEADGQDVVLVAASDSELDYLSACEGYLGDAEQLKASHPDIARAVLIDPNASPDEQPGQPAKLNDLTNPVMFAGENMEAK